MGWVSYRLKKRIAESSLDAARRSHAAWIKKAGEAERRYGTHSEHARHANARVAYFAGVVDRAQAVLARLEVEDKP